MPFRLLPVFMPAPTSPTDRVDHLLDEGLAVHLVSGGDGRMTVRPDSGLNKYGTAPRIRDVLALGNCTASSPSATALEGARESLRRLRRAARQGGDAAIDHEAERLFEDARGALLHELQLDPDDVRVAFCPSGTDAEFLALALVRGGCPSPVVNIVAAPGEVGSGTTNAASGCYFNTIVPAGGERIVGRPIDDELGAAVRLRTIDVRTKHGVMRDPALTDHVAQTQVEQTITVGARAMLHVVAHSKTGVHAPSLTCAERLKQRFGRKVVVLIDAAQGRISRRGLREALARGYLVLFTGSKFYGGPPFSGALLVPRNLWPERTGITALSEGCADFFTAPELPREWAALRESLPPQANIGLVLRWGAAIAAIEAYYRCPGESRLAILRAWENQVPRLLGVSPYISLFPVEPTADDAQRLLESKTTVFPFFLQRGPGAAALDKPMLLRLFDWLNRDMSGLLPDLDEAQKAVLAREVHVGQPVVLTGDAAHQRAVLRLALGASLITRIAGDTRLGPSLRARIDWLTTQVQITRKKLDLLVENLDLLLERDRP